MDERNLELFLEDYISSDVVRAALRRPERDEGPAAGERERVLAGIGVIAQLYAEQH